MFAPREQKHDDDMYKNGYKVSRPVDSTCNMDRSAKSRGKFPEVLEDWINTDKVTALRLRDVSNDWMSTVFTKVVTMEKFKELTSLTLQSLSVTTLTVLDEIRPKLETLNLAGCANITDASLLEVASKCLNLHTLNLRFCSITDASVSEVARRCSNLHTLDLSQCWEIHDASVSEVARRCSKLHTLNLGGCYNITDASVVAVARGCSNLQSLGIRTCRNITDASVSEVARRCSNLHTLDLNMGFQGNNNITDLSVLEVARQCSNLQTLNLGYCRRITDLSVMEVVRRCLNIQSLLLYNCPHITSACKYTMQQCQIAFRYKKK